MSFVTPNTVNTITGIFVGNQVSFSDTLLNLVGSELPFVSFRRSATTSDIMFIEDDLAHSVQMIVIDETMWSDFVSNVPRLRQKFKNANIALAYRKVDTARQLMSASRETDTFGEIGYLPMNVQLDCWLSALRLLVHGERFIPNELLVKTPVAEVIIDRAALENTTDEGEADCELTNDGLCGEAGLTSREMQVLKAVAEGKQNKIIASELSLSQHTVKLHIHHMMSKLGINNRTEAAIWYLGKHVQNDEASP